MDNEKITIDTELKEIEDILIERGEPLPKGTAPLTDTNAIIDVLKLIFDPEISLDVYNLGLIYSVDLSANGDVDIKMTLTSPTCPMADEIPVWIAEAVADVDGVGVVRVNVVWNPPWDLSMISEEGKFQLELDDLEI